MQSKSIDINIVSMSRTVAVFSILLNKQIETSLRFMTDFVSFLNF